MTLQDLDRPADPSVIGIGTLFARVRYAVLWLVAGCALAGAMAVFLYEPGVLEEGVEGVMEGQRVTMGMAMLNAAIVTWMFVSSQVIAPIPV